MASDVQHPQAVPMPQIKLFVVMPVFNEAPTIEEIVGRVLDVPLDKELIIVDDCSTDGTREVLKQLASNVSIRVLSSPAQPGQGRGASTGFADATGDVVLVQDADLEYDPAEYPRLLQPILEGKADVVYGSRFIGGRLHRVLYFWHTVGNRLLTLLSNMFTNLNLTDMETCYKVFRREVMQGDRRRGGPLRLRAGGDGQDREAIAGWRVYEVADHLLRADLRGGQEDRLARRRACGLVHLGSTALHGSRDVG